MADVLRSSRYMYRRGDRFGEYEILSPLRAGGMAMIFVARRTGAGGFVRHVAIKVLRPELSGGYVPALFAREAQLLSRIDHPNVVRVEAFGEASGARYLVLEYVHGLSLAELLISLRDARGSGEMLPTTLAVHVAAAVAQGLHAAHELCGDDGVAAGIVHRDVSPQNVLVSASGHVKLIDFGVARGRVDPLVQATAPGPIGKARYMSPEHAAGQSIDRRADVYALGVVLLEMLVGEEAPLGPAERVRAAHALGGALGAALARALSPSVSTRTATAKMFEDELLDACPQAARVQASELASFVAARAASALPTDPRRLRDEREPERASVEDTELPEETIAPSATRSPPSARRTRGLAIAIGAVIVVASVVVFAATLADPDVPPLAPSVHRDAHVLVDGGATRTDAARETRTATPVVVGPPDPAIEPTPSRRPRPGAAQPSLPFHTDPSF